MSESDYRASFDWDKRPGYLDRIASDSMLGGMHLRQIKITAEIESDESETALQIPPPVTMMKKLTFCEQVVATMEPAISQKNIATHELEHVPRSSPPLNKTAVSNPMLMRASSQPDCDKEKEGKKKHREPKGISMARTVSEPKGKNNSLHPKSKTSSLFRSLFKPNRLQEASSDSTLRAVSNISLERSAPSSPSESISSRFSKSRNRVGASIEYLKAQLNLPQGDKRISDAPKEAMPRSYSADLETKWKVRPKPLPSKIVETSYIYAKKHNHARIININGDLEQVQGKVNQYYLLRDIASGSFGKVVLARDEETFEYYACKTISKNRLRKKFRFSAKSQQKADEVMAEIKREVAILKQIPRHPNIVNLLEVLDDSTEDELYLCNFTLNPVFELCEHGPLMTIHPGSRVKPFSELQANAYFRDVVLGLEFCILD
jgi:Protein kinase domain